MHIPALSRSPIARSAKVSARAPASFRAEWVFHLRDHVRLHMSKLMFLALAYLLAGCATIADPDDKSTPYEPGPDDANIPTARICPLSGQFPPSIPPEAFPRKVSGTVDIRVKVEGGKVVGVESISGPEIYFRPVVVAMRQWKCLVTTKAMYVRQRFEFKFE